MVRFEVVVRWMVEGVVPVEAEDAQEAEDKARFEHPLPWDNAEEADDGGSTSWFVEE